MVSVHLLKPVKVHPRQSICVQAQASALNGVHLVEPDPSMCLTDGLLLTPTLTKFHEGITNVTITNRSGCTWEVEADQQIGSAQKAELVQESQELLVSDAYTEVRRLQPQVPITERKQKLREILCSGLELPQEVQEQLIQLLEHYHDCFLLSEADQGRTDLVQLEIETGDATPCKQRPRRMPFTVREEVSRQLHKMQETGIIQPSSSPWSSPIVLVRKRDDTH